MLSCFQKARTTKNFKLTQYQNKMVPKCMPGKTAQWLCSTWSDWVSIRIYHDLTDFLDVCIQHLICRPMQPQQNRKREFSEAMLKQPIPKTRFNVLLILSHHSWVFLLHSGLHRRLILSCRPLLVAEASFLHLDLRPHLRPEAVEQVSLHKTHCSVIFVAWQTPSFELKYKHISSHVNLQ